MYGVPGAKHHRHRQPDSSEIHFGKPPILDSPKRKRSFDLKNFFVLPYLPTMLPRLAYSILSLHYIIINIAKSALKTHTEIVCRLPRFF